MPHNIPINKVDLQYIFEYPPIPASENMKMSRAILLIRLPFHNGSGYIFENITESGNVSLIDPRTMQAYDSNKNDDYISLPPAPTPDLSNEH